MGRYELKNNVKKELIFLEKTIWNKSNYVSIAPLSENYFIIANYINLLLLNIDNGSICVLEPKDFSDYKRLDSLSSLNSLLKDKDNPAVKKIFNPTGVFIDNNKTLYIANYKGNNILEGKVNPELCQITLTNSYSSINSKGPENVAVDSNHHILVSANYDGSTVTAFNLNNGQELWSTPIEQAHGIAIDDNKIYVTGLTERKIYKLNLFDGKVIHSKGSLGWDPMKSQFLWPTSVSSYNKDLLIISDAHSGFISFLDKKTLNTLKYTGGNGPSYRWLNYPYAAVPIDKGVVILSSMRGNILFLDKSGETVERNLVLFEDNWPSDAANLPYFGNRWDGYIEKKGIKIKIRHKEYRLGYGHLHPITGGPILRVPDVRTLFNLRSYMYFLQGVRKKDVNFIFSSSSETLLSVVNHQHSNPDILLNKEIRRDSWLLNNNIINTDGEKILQSQLIHEFQENANKFYDILQKKLWISPRHLYEIGKFSDDISPLNFEQFLDYLHQIFISPAGKKFKYIYDQCNENFCDTKKLKHAARKYYFETKDYAYLNLDEYLLVGMLSGEDRSDLEIVTEL